MFDKIAIIDNKIAIAKYAVEWQENMSAMIDEKADNKQFEIIMRSEWVIDETHKVHLIDCLEKQELEYNVIEIEIPESIKMHDGEEWTKGRDEAILYINGIGEYNPILIQINNLKQQLADTDYKAVKFAEGLISEAGYQHTRQLREDLREQVNQLEILLLPQE